MNKSAGFLLVLFCSCAQFVFCQEIKENSENQFEQTIRDLLDNLGGSTYEERENATRQLVNLFECSREMETRSRLRHIVQNEISETADLEIQSRCKQVLNYFELIEKGEQLEIAPLPEENILNYRALIQQIDFLISILTNNEIRVYNNYDFSAIVANGPRLLLCLRKILLEKIPKDSYYPRRQVINLLEKIGLPSIPLLKDEVLNQNELQDIRKKCILVLAEMGETEFLKDLILNSNQDDIIKATCIEGLAEKKEIQFLKEVVLNGKILSYPREAAVFYLAGIGKNYTNHEWLDIPDINEFLTQAMQRLDGENNALIRYRIIDVFYGNLLGNLFWDAREYEGFSQAVMSALESGAEPDYRVRNGQIVYLGVVLFRTETEPSVNKRIKNILQKIAETDPDVCLRNLAKAVLLRK